MKFAVIRTGGKQYIVKENQELIVDHIPTEEKQVELPVLATGDFDTNTITMGTPVLKEALKVQVVEHMKGDKVRAVRFKSKTRYRKVTGFRPLLTKLKITTL